VGFFAALATVEEILLEAVNEWKQHTAGDIRRGVDTVGARNSTSQSSYIVSDQTNLEADQSL